MIAKPNEPLRIRWISLNTNPVVGDTDSFVVGVRVVPDGSAGSKVYARTLRPNEVDQGNSVVLYPDRGETLEFRLGSLEIHLSQIYKYTACFTKNGAFCFAHALWAWFGLVTSVDEHVFNYSMAVARRLDLSNELLIRLERIFHLLKKQELTGIPARQHVFESIGTVEAFVIGFHRALRMSKDMPQKISLNRKVPASVEIALRNLEDIRHAYEHIDERAAGLVRGRPDPNALSTFDFKRFLQDGVVDYGRQKFNVFSSGRFAMERARAHVLKCVGDAVGSARRINQPVRFF